MRYSILMPDCPWLYQNPQDFNPARGGTPYPQLSQTELCNLKLDEIADPDSLIFSWGTWPKLKENIEFIEANGFKYVTVGFVWIKLNRNANITIENYNKMPDLKITGGLYSGMGFYTNSNTEYCLIGKRGKGLKRLNKSIKQLIIEPVGTHSSKPPEVRRRIKNIFGDLPRIELFARGEKKVDSEGWVCCGDQIMETAGMDIREALELIKQDKYL